MVFTAVIWGEDKNDTPKHPKVSVEEGKAFPYLDMEMYWGKNGELLFRVHLKPNQELKYLNNDSSHPKHCFEAITKGVLNRLAKLFAVRRFVANRRFAPHLQHTWREPQVSYYLTYVYLKYI